MKPVLVCVLVCEWIPFMPFERHIVSSEIDRMSVKKIFIIRGYWDMCYHCAIGETKKLELFLPAKVYTYVEVERTKEVIG